MLIGLEQLPSSRYTYDDAIYTKENYLLSFHEQREREGETCGIILF